MITKKKKKKKKLELCLIQNHIEMTNSRDIQCKPCWFGGSFFGGRQGYPLKCLVHSQGIWTVNIRGDDL
jgi:hypothetical protein